MVSWDESQPRENKLIPKIRVAPDLLKRGILSVVKCMENHEISVRHVKIEPRCDPACKDGVQSYLRLPKLLPRLSDLFASEIGKRRITDDFLVDKNHSNVVFHTV
jgi:hypothetical protein